RLFRFPLTRDTLPLLASAPIRVNSTGGILTLWLIRLRGTLPANPERVYFTRNEKMQEVRSQRTEVRILFFYSLIFCFLVRGLIL
ncbi:hypothetical protein CW713_04410, partial [Methanophagales archaeon]